MADVMLEGTSQVEDMLGFLSLKWKTCWLLVSSGRHVGFFLTQSMFLLGAK